MFLDTSGIFAFHREKEPAHSIAKSLFANASFCFTHSLVLSEFVALADARRAPRELALNFLTDLMNHPRVEVLWIDARTTLEGVEFLKARLDKSYSLCDAVSFLLMNRRGIRDALTADVHFVQEGFVALLK